MQEGKQQRKKRENLKLVELTLSSRKETIIIFIVNYDSFEDGNFFMET